MNGSQPRTCRHCKQKIESRNGEEVHVWTGKRACGGAPENVAEPEPWVAD